MHAGRKQRGVVLLIFAAILAMGFMAALVYGLGKWRDAKTATRNVNAEVLQQAKAALVGYVAKEVLDLTENIPGRLPCPESLSDAGTTGEGVAANNCAPTSGINKSLGRLPWKTLGLDKLVDSSTEPLWYAVSPNWVLAPAPPVINPGSMGQLSVDGTTDIVAVIIAPGAPLAFTPNANQVAAGCVARSQSRIGDRGHNTSSTTNADYRDYVECQDAGFLAFRSAVIDNSTNEVSNDQIVLVTSKDILNAIQGPIAERMQRTVAPLLSEFGDKWVTAGNKFLPYAVPFKAPEAVLAQNDHCGPAASVQVTEGLLPIATSTGTCSSDWTATFTGDGIASGDGVSATTCTTVGANARCSFRYFSLTPLAQLLFGLLGAGSVRADMQAIAPHGSASFRISSVQVAGDVSVSAGSASLSNFVKPAPRTDGDVGMSLRATMSGSNLCQDSALGGLLCSTLALLGLANTQTVSLDFAQLTAPVLSGTKLSATVKGGASTFNLLSPASTEPHYWYMQNQWYRYTYYAVAPNASAAGAGGNLTVTGFPTTNGMLTNDKHFVLAMVGPAVMGQTRSAGALLGQYVEGQNADQTAPRTFAYQVFAANGNDRIAACPFTDGTTPCD